MITKLIALLFGITLSWGSQFNHYVEFYDMNEDGYVTSEAHNEDYKYQGDITVEGIDFKLIYTYDITQTDPFEITVQDNRVTRTFRRDVAAGVCNVTFEFDDMWDEETHLQRVNLRWIGDESNTGVLFKVYVRIEKPSINPDIETKTFGLIEKGSKTLLHIGQGWNSGLNADAIAHSNWNPLLTWEAGRYIY